MAGSAGEPMQCRRLLIRSAAAIAVVACDRVRTGCCVREAVESGPLDHRTIGGCLCRGTRPDHPEGTAVHVRLHGHQYRGRDPDRPRPDRRCSGVDRVSRLRLLEAGRSRRCVSAPARRLPASTDPHRWSSAIRPDGSGGPVRRSDSATRGSGLAWVADARRGSLVLDGARIDLAGTDAGAGGPKWPSPIES